MIHRRTLVGATAIMLVVPLPGRTQRARKVCRIGILGVRPAAELVGPNPTSPQTAAFLRGMRELGYVYGEHFVTEARGADGHSERFPALAAELVGLQSLLLRADEVIE